jgi:NarL family two-component system response regulator LiaR
MDQARVLIVEDHAVVRQGILAFLGTDPTIEVAGEASNAGEAVCKAESLAPNIILMDLKLPDGDGIGTIAQIKRRRPEVKVLVLTSFGDEARVTAAMKAGADGYLLKDADGEALLHAIQSLRRGGTPIHPGVAGHLVKRALEHKQRQESVVLSERETEVLTLVAQGLSNRAVGEALNISRGTVKLHMNHILGKLRASGRTEAVLRAMKLGLISPTSEGRVP